MAARYQSNFLARLITKRLSELPGLSKKVIHFRDADLESKVDAALAQSGDVAVIVRRTAGRNTSTEHRQARFSGNFTVTIFRVPLLQKPGRKVTDADLDQAAKDADQFLERIIDALNGWWPPEIPHNGTRKLEVTDDEPIEEGEHDITRLVVRAL